MPPKRSVPMKAIDVNLHEELLGGASKIMSTSDHYKTYFNHHSKIFEYEPTGPFQIPIELLLDENIAKFFTSMKNYYKSSPSSKKGTCAMINLVFARKFNGKYL